MATKSDFAQKLLGDLRLRKERMAASQNSSRQTSKDLQGSSGRYYGSNQQINALESASSRKGKTSRGSSGVSSSFTTKEPSNQMVLYGSEQSSRQVRDLSVAIALAFENSGNLKKIGISSNNPLVNFLNRFGWRSLDGRKMDMTSFDTRSVSTYQIPSISHVHINEISKGIQKLNQILRACSTGQNFDRNSIEVGRELLKGAVKLEESLRMLINLQGASNFSNAAQRKNRIELLEEDEDDQDKDHKTTDRWQLDRPKFSFDKSPRNSPGFQGANRNNSLWQQLALSYLDESAQQPVNNSQMVHQKWSSSYGQISSSSTEVEPKDSQSKKEKERISNVIAKLMGLEELPQKEHSMIMQNETKGKEGKERKQRKVLKLPDPSNIDSRNGSSLMDKGPILTNKTPRAKESKLLLKAEKGKETLDGSSKMLNSERKQPPKNLKVQAVDIDVGSGPQLAATIMKKRQNHAIEPNQVDGLQIFEDSERKQDPREEAERKNTTRSESKMPVLNIEQQKRPQRSKLIEAEGKTQNRIEKKASSSYLEKGNAGKDFPSNQQKLKDQSALLGEKVLKKAEHPEQHQAEKKGQYFLKQHLTAKKHEGLQKESIIATKNKNSASTNSKKLSHYGTAPGNGRSMKPNTKVLMKDAPNRRLHGDAHMIDNTGETASSQEILKGEDQSHTSSPQEPEFDIERKSSSSALTQRKPVEDSTTEKKTISAEVHKLKNPRKTDILMTRRDATANLLKRSTKHPAKMLKELKEQMHNRNCSHKRVEQQSDKKVNEGITGISVDNSLEMSSEPLKQQDKLQDEADQTMALNSSNECQVENILDAPALDEKSSDISTKCEKVPDDIQTAQQPYVLVEVQECKQCDQSTGDPEESTEFYNVSHREYKQFPGSGRQELTEQEKGLKEIAIKSQLFLSTAEAHFKLNIPLSLLHVGDQDDQLAEKKLILDCGYEVMKRKARRHEITFHPYTNAAIRFTKVRCLDDLIKHLCKDLEILKCYGGNGGDEFDVANGIYKMLNKDIRNEYPDVNSMWDPEWTQMMSIFPEKEDVIKDVEKHMLNGLLDEIITDF